MNNLHPGLILIATGIIAALLPKNYRKFALAGGPILALVAMFALSMEATWEIPFINDLSLHLLQVDRLSWIFGLIFSIMAAIGGIYSMHNKSWGEALASMTYAGSSLGVVFAGDWVTMIFFWELMAVSSLYLIWGSHTAKSRKAGFRYLLVHMFGGNLLLAGIFLKLSGGDVMISNLTNTGDAAFWLILGGVAINSAIPPLHAWLVDAYPEGTITGSVFLSSFTTKVSVYCLIRIFAGTEFLMWFGVAMALYGVIFAIIENDMRRLLSYHIISQVGFMVTGVGIGTAMALDGATAHAFSHILYKSLLFMCAGAVIYATGKRKLSDLGGLAKKMPWVCIFFTIAAFSISGIPLFNGFISKSITISAAAEAGLPAIELLLQLASIGTFLSITMKMIYFMFFGEDKGLKVKPLPKNMMVAMSIGAGLCVLYGIFPSLLYTMLPNMTVYHPYTVDHIVQYVQMLGMAMIPFMAYLAHMKPKTKISLDTDWFYRKPLVWLVSGISSFCCAMRDALGIAWKESIEAMGPFFANPMGFLGTLHSGGETPKEYDPDAYRPLVAEPMLVIFLILAIILAYFWLI